MKKLLHLFACACLAWLVLAPLVMAAPPQTMSYQGYLTNAAGAPINSPQVMTFRIYDDLTAGSLLWSGTQLSVPVTNGVFNVILGGSQQLTAFPPTLVFDKPYFLSVQVNPELLEMTPRQPLQMSPYAYRSVVADSLAPTALITGSQVTGAITVAAVITSNSGGIKYPDGLTQTKALANCSLEGDVAVMHLGAWVCRSSLPRYVDNGDGTVTDNNTGLMWEKKLAPTDAACLDAVQINRNVRCQQNTYTWSAATPFTEPTGTLFSDFLEQLNDLKSPNDGTATSCFANHCDWRIPAIGELRSIFPAPFPGCSSIPCIDAIFGPTQQSFYWSSSSYLAISGFAWFGYFSSGFVDAGNKGNVNYARAVRSGR
jgi:hypothetical protein